MTEVTEIRSGIQYFYIKLDKMVLEQIFTGCLAEAAYYIESNGEAAVIDPLRETKPYLSRAKESGAKIKYVFETHFHADFVSGHVDLAAKSGATIVFGPNGETGFDSHIAKDGEEFKIGALTIKVLHTPGHTMESTTYLLLDEKGKEHAIFSGDTLFIGDVGRPDLAVKSDLSQEDLAKHLFHSLREKIMPLNDDVIVYPAHGAGSACGKMMSSETFDTLGHQKETNYALRADMSEEEFVKEVLTGLTAPPQYFPKNAMMNKMGYDSFEAVLKKGNIPLNKEEFEEMVNTHHAMVLDTRTMEEFQESHIPRSIFIGLDGNFAPWVGSLITDIDQPIVLVAPEGREEEAVTRLSRVGYDNTLGYLEGGIEAWKKQGGEVDSVDSISAEELAKRYAAENMRILDVRKESEYKSEHVEGAENFPLDDINSNMTAYPAQGTNYLHCKSGYRSMITASILKSRGFHNFVDVNGGFEALSETAIPKTEYVCPSTLL